MVLAAGLGERMRPLTLHVPKPALPVLGRPMILQVLSSLAEQGITRTVVNLHHLPEAIRALVGDGSSCGLEVVYSMEPSILGTGGGVRQAAPHLRGKGTLVVRNGDFLADVDLGAALRCHRASGKPATLVLARHRPPYTAVEVGDGGAILSFGGVPPAAPGSVRGRYLFTGMHVIEESVLDRIPGGGPSDIVRHVYRDLASRGELNAYVHPGFWWEFGTPGEFLEGSLRLLRLDAPTRRAVAITDSVREIGACRVALGAGADLHAAGLDLRGGVALGYAALVAEGVSLEDTIVMPESWIGPGARLRRVLVGRGTEIPAGFAAEGAMVCPYSGGDEPLPDGIERSEGLLIRRFEAATA